MKISVHLIKSGDPALQRGFQHQSHTCNACRVTTGGNIAGEIFT